MRRQWHFSAFLNGQCGFALGSIGFVSPARQGGADGTIALAAGGRKMLFDVAIHVVARTVGSKPPPPRGAIAATTAQPAAIKPAGHAGIAEKEI